VDNLTPRQKITRSFNPVTNLPKALIVLAIVSVISGVATGFVLAQNNPQSGLSSASPETKKASKEAGQVAQNCKDFDEGTIRAKEQADVPEEYSEGTHLLDRGTKSPVTLTSSYVDLSEFEGKKVKVFGETQKALKAGWLMDVCKIEQS
jgi:hypothetical protein